MTVPEIVAALPGLSVLVVGDLCLDAWCRYDPRLTEPSRETGIPRIAVVSRELTPGAAGTVASNLKTLGVGQTQMLSVIGGDGHAFDLLKALDVRGIGAAHILQDPGRATFTYTKLINHETGSEDLPRIDYVPTDPVSPLLEDELVRRLKFLAAAADVIIVSDQAETDSGGIVTEPLRAALRDLASHHPGTVFWVDSRKRGELFRGLLVKLNQQEAAECCQRLFGRLDYEALLHHVDYPYLIVTRGAAGASVIAREGVNQIAGRSIANPVDICGAGDSFNAAAACALALTRDPVKAVQFGNLAASITVMKPGTGTASPDEVLAAI